MLPLEKNLPYVIIINYSIPQSIVNMLFGKKSGS
jgi:hypothetical protein